MHPKSLLSRFQYRRMITLLLAVTILLAGITGPLYAQATVARRDQPSQPGPVARSTVTHAETLTSTLSPHPDLAEALSFAPATVSYIEFTYWDLLKTWSGLPNLDSRSEMDDRTAFMLAVGREEHALATGFGRSYFLQHAEMWGWDSTDLRWEASFPIQEGGIVYILRLRDDFDLGDVTDRFDEREFTRTELTLGDRSIPLYSHPMDLSAEWLRTTEFAILNTALLAEENTLILSSVPAAVKQVLAAWDTNQTLAARTDVQAAAHGLGTPGAAFLDMRGCPPLDVARYLLGASDPASLRALLEELMATGPSGLYTIQAIGYHQEGGPDDTTTPVGVFVYHYPLAEQAHADLDVRRTIAATGQSSVRTDIAYADLFRVHSATVTDHALGANLILTLEAIERAPQLFFDMLLQGDLMFSLCGS